MYAPILKQLKTMVVIKESQELKEQLIKLIESLDNEYLEIKKKRREYKKEHYTPRIPKPSRKTYIRKPREQLKTNDLKQYHKQYYLNTKRQREQEQS